MNCRLPHSFLGFLVSILLKSSLIIFSLNYISNAASEDEIMPSSSVSTLIDRSCLELTALHFQQISDIHDSDDPSVYVIAPSGKEYAAGPICIGAVVAIPTKYSGTDDYGVKIEDTPPDSIYLDIIGNDFLVIPDTVANFTFFKKDDIKFRYYQLNVLFRDSDTYKLTGYLEVNI
jgi:hypothetical protein